MLFFAVCTLRLAIRTKPALSAAIVAAFGDCARDLIALRFGGLCAMLAIIVFALRLAVRPREAQLATFAAIGDHAGGSIARDRFGGLAMLIGTVRA